MIEKTPLEQLIEMNEQVRRTRKRPARRREPPKDVERFYRTQLRSLIRAIRREIDKEVMPEVRQNKADYTLDSVVTMDTWSDRIIALIAGISERFTSQAFEQQYDRLAARTVSMAEASSTRQFLESVNQAIGVDMGPILDQAGIRDYLQVASYQNAQLIKSVPQEFLKGIENAVIGGIRAGNAPSEIAKQIQKQTGIADRRAQLIARDQVAKMNGEITERRQRQSGIKFFRWSTSKDARVGDDHRAAAARDVGYGKGVYRWDQPPKEGIPGRATRPNCRCVAIPVFEWELPNAS